MKREKSSLFQYINHLMASDWFCSVAALCFSFPVGGGGASYAGHQDGGRVDSDGYRSPWKDRVSINDKTTKRDPPCLCVVSICTVRPSVRPSVVKRIGQTRRVRRAEKKKKKSTVCERDKNKTSPFQVTLLEKRREKVVVVFSLPSDDDINGWRFWDDATLWTLPAYTL